MQVSQNPLPPGAPVASSVQLDGYPGRPMAVPLMAGTPRYLLFRNVYNEDLRPPKVIPNASILFQVRPAGPLPSPPALQQPQLSPSRCCQNHLVLSTSTVTIVCEGWVPS